MYVSLILLEDIRLNDGAAASVPNQRILHYWSKASLFAHPIANYVLTSSGCIPVDRKNKDRMILFKGTFDTLRKDKVVALFPEGTSYTEPRIMQVKDGAAWAALEYAKLQREKSTGKTSKGIVIVPVAIVYTNKSKYRSDVSLSFPARNGLCMTDWGVRFWLITENLSSSMIIWKNSSPRWKE